MSNHIATVLYVPAGPGDSNKESAGWYWTKDVDAAPYHGPFATADEAKRAAMPR